MEGLDTARPSCALAARLFLQDCCKSRPCSIVIRQRTVCCCIGSSLLAWRYPRRVHGEKWTGPLADFAQHLLQCLLCFASPVHCICRITFRLLQRPRPGCISSLQEHLPATLLQSQRLWQSLRSKMPSELVTSQSFVSRPHNLVSSEAITGKLI